jgi:hypothetical protein
LVHTRARGAAHSSQNFASGRFSCWHRAHFIVSLGVILDSVATESVAGLAVEDAVQCA